MSDSDSGGLVFLVMLGISTIWLIVELLKLVFEERK